LKLNNGALSLTSFLFSLDIFLFLTKLFIFVSPRSFSWGISSHSSYRFGGVSSIISIEVPKKSSLLGSASSLSWFLRGKPSHSTSRVELDKLLLLMLVTSFGRTKLSGTSVTLTLEIPGKCPYEISGTSSILETQPRILSKAVSISLVVRAFRV